MKKNIYCPECLKRGYKKKLLEVEDNATGIIYPYCKCCHKNVTIKLNNRVPECHS